MRFLGLQRGMGPSHDSFWSQVSYQEEFDSCSILAIAALNNIMENTSRSFLRRELNGDSKLGENTASFLRSPPIRQGAKVWDTAAISEWRQHHDQEIYHIGYHPRQPPNNDRVGWQKVL